MSALNLLYQLPVLFFAAALLFLVRGKRERARQLALFGAVCGVAALLVYWYLTMSA